MKFERCDICDELTGNAGTLDDSLVCCKCGKVICEQCLDNDYYNEDDECEKMCVECSLKLL
jgi:hypothetical protein